MRIAEQYSDLADKQNLLTKVNGEPIKELTDLPIFGRSGGQFAPPP